MRDRAAAQSVAMLFGAVFLLVGILGFIPGITTDYDQLAFAGEDSEALLLGIFQVSILHNLVHVVFGIAGLALARTAEGARIYLIGGGVVYLGLWILGLVGGAEWLPTNDADHWLHFALGIVMIAFGFLTGRERIGTATTA